ncbi:hypothetical protein FUA23_09545 [Neolewinella aurantiaca]|uniref:Por secretion system C-terminal sorting domain-containing protein n=1 Tax=Neolewinella aurantiaca TaxID=2602767 RepID=A0A5C7FH05_9BACT|nr:hypothetical protein [Neolewinella aurantiaca]TXF89684.1 hypothetical protein FUA23_09545 [Neolewinella aurantiaca]
MLFGLFLTSLSFPAIAFAQNSISGKLINGQNISGIELFANKTPGDSSKFNLNGESVSNLPPGTYVIKISLDDDTQVIEKFLKK